MPLGDNMKLLQQSFSVPASDLDNSSFKSLLIRRRWTELLQQVKDDPAFASAQQNGSVSGRQLRSNDATKATAADDEEEPATRQQVQEQTPAQIAAAKRKHKQLVNSLGKQRKEKLRLMDNLQQRLDNLNKEKHQLVTQLKQALHEQRPMQHAYSMPTPMYDPSTSGQLAPVGMQQMQPEWTPAASSTPYGAASATGRPYTTPAGMAWSQHPTHAAGAALQQYPPPSYPHTQPPPPPPPPPAAPVQATLALITQPGSAAAGGAQQGAHTSDAATVSGQQRQGAVPVSPFAKASHTPVKQELKDEEVAPPPPPPPQRTHSHDNGRQDSLHALPRSLSGAAGVAGGKEQPQRSGARPAASAGEAEPSSSGAAAGAGAAKPSSLLCSNTAGPSSPSISQVHEEGEDVGPAGQQDLEAGELDEGEIEPGECSDGPGPEEQPAATRSSGGAGGKRGADSDLTSDPAGNSKRVRLGDSSEVNRSRHLSARDAGAALSKPISSLPHISSGRSSGQQRPSSAKPSSSHSRLSGASPLSPTSPTSSLSNLQRGPGSSGQLRDSQQHHSSKRYDMPATKRSPSDSLPPRNGGYDPYDSRKGGSSSGRPLSASALPSRPYGSYSSSGAHAYGSRDSVVNGSGRISPSPRGHLPPHLARGGGRGGAWGGAAGGRGSMTDQPPGSSGAGGYSRGGHNSSWGAGRGMPSQPPGRRTSWS